MSLLLRISFEAGPGDATACVDCIVTKTVVPASAGESAEAEVKVVAPPANKEISKVLRTSMTPFADEGSKATTTTQSPSAKPNHLRGDLLQQKRKTPPKAYFLFNGNPNQLQEDPLQVGPTFEKDGLAFGCHMLSP